MAITKQDAIIPVYTRDPPPGRPEKLSVYTADELRKIELVLRRSAYLAPQVTDVVPAIKYKGMIRYATSPWDPLGTGDAWVWWNGAAWVALASGGGAYTTEQAQDDLAAAFAAGTHTGITITYNDAANKFDFANLITQYTDEMARDALGAALVAGAGITITPNDGADTITIAGIVTQYTNENAMDAIAAMIQNGTGITWSYNDAGDQLTPTVTITQWSDELVDDRVAALIQNGTGITWSYNDAGGTLTPTVTITQYTDEMAQDTVAAMIQPGTGITWSYNDAGNLLTPTVTITQYTDELAQDALAAAFAAGTHTGLTITYTDVSNKFDFAVAAQLFAGTAEVDFGAFPGSTDCSVAVTGQTTIAAGSKVFTALRLVASADHSADEHFVEAIQIYAGNIIAGTGFTIYARDGNQLREQDPVLSGVGPRIYGKWEVSWSWSL